MGRRRQITAGFYNFFNISFSLFFLIELTKDGVPWEESGYHEGDIVLSQTDLTRNGVKDEELRWTDGVIPYYIDESFGMSFNSKEVADM